MTETAEAKQQTVPSRQLVLHVMLSLLVSVAVFVVVSWMVLVPQLARHEKRIRILEAEIAEMQEAAEAEVPPAPEAPATEATAPAAEKK